jgi:hypothetical protein
VRFPDHERAETHVVAELQAGGLPVSIAGSVGGVGPELVEYTIWGSRQSCRIVDWNRLVTSDGGEWEPQLTHLDDPRQLGYQLQLDNAAAAIAGASHSMPDFADALSVHRRQPFDAGLRRCAIGADSDRRHARRIELPV